MPDLLVRLYNLPSVPAETRLKANGITIRRALPPEAHLLHNWIRTHFNEGWVSECQMGMSHFPVSVWVAVKDGAVLGFACHDATALGFFGPTGVMESARGKGIGEALLMATLHGMAEAGYGYAIIGAAGPVAFYQKRLDAIEIPDSVPGIYAGMVTSNMESRPR